MDMQPIIDGLYLGGRTAAVDVEGLIKSGVTHVLTIEAHPLNKTERSDKLVYHYVYAVDMFEADLLTHFQECFDFIDEARKKGAVLIHCLVGMSRSATIATAYLMRLKKIGLSKALAIVHVSRTVRPNRGFQDQLLTFEAMGCEINENNKLYRKYRLERMATRVQTDDMDFQTGDLLENPCKGNDNSFRCAKCRQPLFRREGVMMHNVGIGEAAFYYRNKAHIPESERSDVLCNKSLFIEPVEWMEASIRTQSGKLMCPKCKVKIGSFTWCGEKCPCGEWVAPAFHIQSSKVDEWKQVVIPQRQHVTPTIVDKLSELTLMTKHIDPMPDSGVQPEVT